MHISLLLAALAAPMSMVASTQDPHEPVIAIRSDNSTARARAVATVLDHPEAVDPFDYALVVKWLWENGRRQQAAFWFYLFQERSRPWSLADKAGDGAAALRLALNDEMGALINGWVASDPVAWAETAKRAISFDKTFPLYHERPSGMTVAQWTALVARSRTEYDAQAIAAFAGMDQTEIAAQRRANGLRVGPLDAPGPALPEAWR